MKKILFFVSAVTLLASCSKEITEDVAAPVTGKSTIYATYDGGQSATRTTAAPNGTSYRLLWELGDAVGVFDAVAEDETNAYFAYAGSDVAFNGDMGFLYAENYIGYYPYEKGRTIAKDGNITLTIPSTQNYRFNAIDETAGSFAQNVAPAVAYGTASADNELSLTFYPMATYLRIPIKGIGTVRTLELSISDDVKLAGDFTVNLEDVKAATKASDIKINYEGSNFNEEKITLVCGKGDKGVALNPSKETYFWFVVPAGTKLKNQTMTIVVNGEDKLTRTFEYEEESSLPVNTPIKMGQDAIGTAFEWVEDGSFLITNEYEFLMYAYAATNGLDGVYDPMVKDNALRSSVIVNPLDFTPVAEGGKFDSDPTISAAESYGDYLTTVLLEYQKNGNAIETIGGKQVFEIEGNIAGKPAFITGLTVKGNAMFHDKAKNIVKKITFTKSTVDATGLKSEAFFLADRYVTSTSANPNISFTDVTVDETCQVLVDADNKKAIVGRAFTDTDNTVIVNETEMNYANVLYIKGNYATFVEGEEGCIDLTRNALTVHVNHSGAILNVKGETEAANLIDEIDLTVSNAAKWYSVVSGYKKAGEVATVKASYWTGIVADYDAHGASNAKNDNIFTAEELASAVKSTRGNISLTNDINLMGGITKEDGDLVAKASGKGQNWASVLENAMSARLTVTGDNFVISNAWIQPEKDATVKDIALFGTAARVENLIVSNVVINDKNVENANVAGLAIKTYQNLNWDENGYIRNVKVNNMDITAKNVNAPVGGVIGIATEKIELNNVEFVGRVTGTKGYNNRASIAGTLTGLGTINNLTYTGLKATLQATTGKTNYMSVFGQVIVSKPTTSAAVNYDLCLNVYDFDATKFTADNFVAAEGLMEDIAIQVNYEKNGSHEIFQVEVPEQE